MLTLEVARERILTAIQSLPAEAVPLSVAAGRVLGAPVLSPIDLPPFDNSAMDGYALQASAVETASAATPVALRCAGQVAAGEVWPQPLAPGTCVRVFTGSPLPPGADAVVMQEDTRVQETEPASVLVLDRVQPWENVRFRGEDVKLGVEVLEPGTRLQAGAISLLAALGLREVQVRRQPTIVLLATGSELVEAGQALPPGKIFESNRSGLAACLQRVGAEPRMLPLVPDNLAATREALERALAEADAVITSGGVSVGELDFVKRAFEQLGGQLEFWQVALRPGKPFVFGRRGEKFLFGLPGNPVSALVTFLLLVRPAVLRWQGATQLDLPGHPGVLVEPLVNRGDRRHFVRVQVDATGRVRPAGTQASHILSSFATANGLVDVPPGATLEAGSQVHVLRWDFA